MITINKVVCLNEASGVYENWIKVFTFATRFFCGRGGGEFDIRHKEPCLGLRLYASHNLNSWRVKHFSKCQRADQITNVFMSSKAVKDRNRGNLFTW